MTRIISSPLQGYTDYRFRNAYDQFFGGIDQYMAPYIRLSGDMKVKPSNERDILPKNNEGIDLLPQIMAKNAKEFLFIAKYLEYYGYSELSWNLGCPYPMVTKRGMGSGMLSSPGKIDEILSVVFSESDIKISIKMRLGYDRPEEIFEVLAILEKHPLEYIVVHPRIGKQIYKGEVDIDSFEKCLNQSSHEIFYNGDINTVQQFRDLKDRFPSIENFLLGRGILMDPFLPAMIKADTDEYPVERYQVFQDFHDTLFESYREALSGNKQILMKMFHFWEYFIYSFPNSRKGLKKIKKAQSIFAYEEAVKEMLLSA